jgi:hypothetical protein
MLIRGTFGNTSVPCRPLVPRSIPSGRSEMPIAPDFGPDGGRISPRRAPARWLTRTDFAQCARGEQQARTCRPAPRQRRPPLCPPRHPPPARLDNAAILS